MDNDFGKTFAEQISPLIDKANQDVTFRKEFLAHPQQVLQAHQINCPSKIIVEYHEDYGTYCEIEFLNAENKSATISADETFKETHFMDCHQL